MASKASFNAKIKDELEAIIEEQELGHLPAKLQSGKAFEQWCLDLLGQWHSNIDTDPSNIPDSGDGGVDILLEDTAANRFILAQCSFVGKNGSFKIDKWTRTCELARDLLDEDQIASGAYGTAQDTRDALLRVARRIKEAGASVDVLFMTTASVNQEHQVHTQKLSDELDESGVRVAIWDQLRLRRVLDDVESADAEAIDGFTFDVPEGRYFEVDAGDNIGHVLSIGAAKIAQEFDAYGQRLLAWNIRNYLGANTINSKIRGTAEDRPTEFFLCNNGITAIARKVEKTGGKHHTKLVCDKFQVINGGQTLASLAEVYKNPETRSRLSEISVLFTIIETKETSPTSSFNRRVIQARNTQNKVLLSDFRANDRVQQWLEKNLGKHAASVLPKSGLADLEKCRRIYYKRKRDFHRQKGALKLELEELAKIRYAYLYEPWTVLAYVNQLWTRKGEEEKAGQPGKKGEGVHDATGKYELAFGSVEAEGEPVKWEDEELTHAVFAIVLHEDAKRRAKGLLAGFSEKEKGGVALTDSESLKRSYLTRSRYHAVALGGEVHRQQPAGSLRKLMGDSEALLAELEAHWKICLLTFQATIDPKLEDIGRDTVLRSPKYWANMVEFYTGIREVQST